MFRILAVVVVLFVPLTGYCANPDNDAHDQLVYGRYNRKLQTAKMKYVFEMKHQELDRPATRAESSRAGPFSALKAWAKPVSGSCPNVRCFPPGPR